MDDATPALPPAKLTIGSASPPSSSRLRWLEFFLVLSLSFAHPLFASFHLLKTGPLSSTIMNSPNSLFGLFHEACCLLLLAYVLFRRRLTFRHLGLRWSVRDLGVGLLLGVLSPIIYAICSGLIIASARAWGGPVNHLPSALDFFAHPSLVAIPFTLLNPFFEELIVRAYVMTEILELTGSGLVAVLFSTVLQTAYHLYYGWIVAAAMGGTFLVYSLYFYGTRKATPIVTAHAFEDIFALIQLFLH